MFRGQPILIVEDEPLIAMDLADAIEGMDGEVVGPLASVANALEHLDRQTVSAAILDSQLIDSDITPVALRLLLAKIPFVIYSGTGLPLKLEAQFHDIPLIMKPTTAQTVALRLLIEIEKLDQ
jgi:DNA-binding NtrC family response regulator